MKSPVDVETISSVEKACLQVALQALSSRRSSNRRKKSKMKMRNLPQNITFTSIFIVSLLHLLLISTVIGVDRRACYAIPKECDIYNGGYTHYEEGDWDNIVNKTDQKCIRRQFAGRLAEFDKKFTAEWPEDESDNSGNPKMVCKVRVGPKSVHSFWAECAVGCYDQGSAIECKQECLGKETEGCQEYQCSSSDRRCTQGCSKCQFPFVHLGIEHKTCTNAGINAGDEDLDFKWCATQVNETNAVILRAECECVDELPVKAKAETTENGASLDVSFTQDKLDDSLTKFKGKITGLEQGSEYQLKVYDTTDAEDCSATVGTPFELFDRISQEKSEKTLFPDLTIEEGEAKFEGSTKFIDSGIIDLDSGEDTECPQKSSLLRRVLVLEKKNLTVEDQWDKVACTPIKLLTPDETNWPVIILIIIAVLIILIILIVIIYCCVCRRRKDKSGGSRNGTPPTSPTSPELENGKPLIPVNPNKQDRDFSSGNIPFIDEPEKEDVNRSITDLFFEKRLQNQQSQESISNRGSYTSDEMI